MAKPEVSHLPYERGDEVMRDDMLKDKEAVEKNKK